MCCVEDNNKTDKNSFSQAVRDVDEGVVYDKCEKKQRRKVPHRTSIREKGLQPDKVGVTRKFSASFLRNL